MLIKFLETLFIYELLGTINILELIVRFGYTYQNLKASIWKHFNDCPLMKNTQQYDNEK